MVYNMGRKRKRSKRVRRVFFTVVLLSMIVYSGFLLKQEIVSIFDRVVEGAAAEGGANIIEDNTSTDHDNIDSTSNSDENNQANSHGNNNMNNNTSNNSDDTDNNVSEKNQTVGKNNNYNKNSSSKQLVENTDDILVVVNKKRYLDSDYKPGDLAIPDVKFSFDGEHEKKYMRQEAAAALEELFGQAYEEGIYIFALSGYRSYNTQKWLFESRANKVGEEEANKLTARPGESEHQTGLAMDITSQSVGFDLKEEFGQTKEGVWVRDNAHKFGFIVRYAKDKVDITGYSYEPWHIRYVGKEVAEELYNRGIALEEYFK